jgi:polyhydroxyalkanoate synthase subunit PhaC
MTEDRNESHQGELSLDLMKQMIEAGYKVTEDYLEDIPTRMHYLTDVTKNFMALSNKMTSNIYEVCKAQNSYLSFMQAQQELWKRTFEQQLGQKVDSVITPNKNDKRFNAPEWEEMPYFNFLKQNYLLMSQFMTGIVDSVNLDKMAKRKLNFYTQQFLDAMSPSNFAATNPEVLKLAQETNGQSLIEGFKNMLEDMEKGRITQTDVSAFEVGKNLAITSGAVVYENELIQLIQYTPTTKTVQEIPLLMVPPWINKYYILDLRPENSYVKYIVDQGFTVFMISWRNPTPEMGKLRFDDYIDLGSMKAMEVVKSITGSEKINLLGYCLGGTLIGATLAIMARKKIDYVSSVTLLATMLDFSYIGDLDVAIDEMLVTKLEGELHEGTVMKGEDMATAFNLIRANDLIWNYVVNNYLKGKKPPSFDILYWTNDNTNLPAKMYAYYLRNMVYENKLKNKDELVMCDTPIDLTKINVPAYIVGTKEDHISPAVTNFMTTKLLSGPVEFVLGGSGHVMGIINLPIKNKYGYYVNGKLGNGYEEWKKTAEFREGSWWTHWTKWLQERSGKSVKAPEELGSKDYPMIEPAPGRYVKEGTHNG